MTMTYTFDVQVHTGAGWTTVWSETCDGTDAGAADLARDVWGNQVTEATDGPRTRVLVWQGTDCTGRPAAIWPADRTDITDRDMKDQIVEALGANATPEWVDRVFDAIHATHGLVDIDAVPADEFWQTVSDTDPDGLKTVTHRGERP